MINYAGGKSHISDWIINEMNALARNTNLKWRHYAEPFSGAFWVYWRLPIERIRTFETVVYNDLNFEMVNMITCLRDRREELIEAPTLIAKEMGLKDNKLPLADRDVFFEIRDEFFRLYRNEDDRWIIPNPIRVIMFAYLHHYSFIGSVLKPNIRPVNGKIPEGDRWKDIPVVRKAKDPKFVERVKHVTHIERKDCEQIINEFDSPDTFFYVDPPYWETEHYYTESVEGFGPDKHESLANTLKEMKGKFALSYYDFPQLNEWFPHSDFRWERKIFKNAMMAREGLSNDDREEVLILNDKGEEGLLSF